MPKAEATERSLVVLSDSVKELAAFAAPAAVLDPTKPTVVRTTLSDPELATTMQFEVALKMRDFAGLQARIANGEIISPAEMAEKYYPLASDYESAIAWVEGLGLKVSSRYDDHLSFFVRGTVAQIRDALQVSFVRVAYLGGEYTSADSAPRVLEELAAALVGINGLQPHLRLRAQHTRLRPQSTTNGYAPYTPANLQAAYNASTALVNGSGETIGIIGFAYASSVDLSIFWQNCGISQSINSITDVQVGGGPGSAPFVDDVAEASLDVEWSSALAPGASIRVYGTEQSDIYASEAFQQVISDLPSQPQMHQISMSYGLIESQVGPSQAKTDAQYLATIASAGVTLFFSSGDGGSRPDSTDGTYAGSSGVPAVIYPASDLSVTGVGGTSLSYNGLSYSETVWFSNAGASGGGPSSLFSRPSWQTGEGVPDVSQRLVPDVASSADPYLGAYVILGGQEQPLGGTSWGAPCWAGFCALFNQARIAAGLGPVGLLNPRIYPFLGTPCFQDITSGTNGDFVAGPGYDECTGIGTPNVGYLIQALSTASTGPGAPFFLGQPGTETIADGYNATFGVAVFSMSTASYQWQMLVPGSSAWVNLSDNTTYSGSSTDSLLVVDVTAPMEGDEFRCIVTNAIGSATSIPGVLQVPPIAPPFADLAGSLLYVAAGDFASIGEYISGYPGADTGPVIGPVTYQWYHDGVAVPGATSVPYIIHVTGFSDAGDYVLTVTNPTGTVASYQEGMVVTSGGNYYGWLDAQQQGSIVYFLYASPAQILRYDLGAGSWMAPVSLGAVPTAFRTSAEGVYVAFGQSASLYSLDLSTSTPLANTAVNTTSIFLNGSFVYLLGTPDKGQTGSYAAYDRSTGSAVATTPGLYFEKADVSASLGKLFGWWTPALSQPQLASVAFGPGGTVNPSTENSSAFFGQGTRVWTLPGGELFADDTGAVYDGTDLSYAGSFGQALDDLCFLPDGSPVACRGNEITLYGATSLQETGRVALQNGALRIFSNGNVVTGFSAPTATGGPIPVEQVTEAQLSASPRPTAPVVPAPPAGFIPDDGFIGVDGQLYLLGKLYRSIFVWSLAAREYVSTIPLQGSPQFMSYSPVLNRVYLAYDDGRMTKIDLATSHAEAAFSEFSAQLYDMVAADNQLYVDVGGPLGYTERFLCDSSGNIESRTGSPSFLNLAYWDSNQQAFFCTVTNGLGIEMLPVSGGTFGGAVDSSYSNDLSVGTGPIRFSGDGSLLVSGAGLVIASATLAQSGALSLPSVDSAWLGSDIFSADLSLSGTSVQQWVGPGYTAGNATALPGYPLRIWPTPGGGLIAMTDVNGTATMAVLDDSGNSVPFAPPVITIEPTNQTSSGGSTVVFSAAAKGSATYQWQFDGVNLSNGGSVSGATGPQLVLGNVTSANEGTYSCLVTGSSGSILTDMANLVVNTSATPGAVSSISSRAFVGTGDNILIGGFYVVGGTSRTVLVQAIGPALAADPYNVSGTLQHPKLSIHQNQNGQDVTLYSNTGWGPNPVLLGAAATAYAEPVLQPGSADSELLVTLPPGGYTAEVSGADGGTGVALVAIYQLP